MLTRGLVPEWCVGVRLKLTQFVVAIQNNMEGAMVRTLAESGELPQTVRVNDRGQISVVDVVMNVCFTKEDGLLTNSARSNALTYYRRLQSEHQELTTTCVSYKFPGRGQQETPVAGKNGILQILQECILWGKASHSRLSSKS